MPTSTDRLANDWRSYDDIADRYDAVWAPRFEAVAAEIWRRVHASPGDRVLDIGTGTGVVPRTLITATVPRAVVGCDRSAAMLRHARARTPALRVVSADARELPFRSGTFSIVTASCVLSHVDDYTGVLAEAQRVLAGGGVAAASAWGPVDDAYSAAWSELLAAEITAEAAARASREVAPAEDRLSQPGALATAMAGVGFADAATQEVEISIELPVQQFLLDRELNSASRLAQTVLGAAGWSQFRDRARAIFAERFGPCVAYTRRALIVTARKP